MSRYAPSTIAPDGPHQRAEPEGREREHELPVTSLFVGKERLRARGGAETEQEEVELPETRSNEGSRRTWTDDWFLRAACDGRSVMQTCCCLFSVLRPPPQILLAWRAWISVPPCDPAAGTLGEATVRNPPPGAGGDQAGFDVLSQRPPEGKSGGLAWS